ncbi:MAG TPA: carboxypeptidase regulatory-like domain-containing protein [Fibrobacteria bacterium]|nr:carboxypeptidase regulatory-like domain-containing protein [Fibrobacteria bacterium]
MPAGTRRRSAPIALTTALAFFLWLAGCLFQRGEETASTRGSEVENQVGLYGRIFDVHGRPVEGVKVRALPSSQFALGKPAARPEQVGPDTVAADTFSTDAWGTYSFRHLPKGVYNLLGGYFKDGKVVFVGGVSYAGAGKNLDVGDDTLREPGRILGQVLLNGKGVEKVFCYLPGTSYLAITDGEGRFALSKVPQGTYILNYLAAGLAGSPDTGIRVSAGKDMILPAKELTNDTALPPPMPTGLSITAYDSLEGVVYLHWHPVQVADLAGYALFRNQAGSSELTRINAGPWQDTAFPDTLHWSEGDTARLEMEWRVKAQDRAFNVSNGFSDPVRLSAASPNLLRTSFAFRRKLLPGDAGQREDTLQLVSAFDAHHGRIDSLAWFREGAAIPLLRAKVGAQKGEDTLTYVITGSLATRFRIMTWASDGKAWEASHRFVLVRPDYQWLRTGILVPAKSLLEIHASGEMIGRLGEIYGPDGGSGLGGSAWLVPNQPSYALFARIGGGNAFKIGSSFLGLAQQEGELEIGININGIFTGFFLLDSLSIDSIRQ